MLPRIFQPEEPAQSPFTVADVIDLYLRYSRAVGLHCPEALADRERTLGLFAEVHGALPISECKPFHLSDWIEAHPTWKSVSTRRAKANEIRAAFQWACNGERIDRNPFLKVRYAEAERRPEMPDDVLDKLCALANKPYERAARFMRLTGCRCSELCRARWRDVDLERGVWTIPYHKSKHATKRPKIVALVKEAVDLLTEIRAIAVVRVADSKAGMPTKNVPTDADFIFTNTRGRPWNRRTLGQQIERMKRRYGIECKASLHGIRHKFAGQAVANGAPIALISAQLGHQSISTTQRYYVDLSGSMDAIRAAAEMAKRKEP